MKLPSRFLLSGLLFFASNICLAQTGQFLYPDNRPPVSVNAQNLPYPWAGGFNSPLVNPIDLNGDGILDLFTFDRTCNRLTPFINSGAPGDSSYSYAPEYFNRFPSMNKWVRTADYDCDGDLDLFCYGNKSIQVYRNDFTTGAGLSFTLINTHLITWFGTFFKDISASDTNVPVFYDLGGDGDIDVLTFSTSGNNIEYYRNYYADSSAGSCAGFNFNYESACWGYMQLNQLANIADLNIVCRGNVIDNSPDRTVSNGNRHSGSCLAAFDQHCDGDVDLLNGDILGSNLLYLENGGTPDSAYIVTQDSLFPSYNTSVLLNNLPAASYLDIDNDSINDLVITPSANSGEDYNNVLFYKNTGTNCNNLFAYQSNRWLIDGMVDLGSSSLVSVADIDQDGLLDMIVGNDRYYNANPALSYSQIAYFHNTGTINQPAFTLVNNDWLGLSAFQQYGLYPTFGDLDGDGDKDLLIGTGTGDLLYYQNSAGAGNPAVYTLSSPQYQGIQGTNNAAPQLIDVDRDGLIDLLIGNRSGRIRYFRNSGTLANPVFSLTNSFFGSVNVTKQGSVAGLAVPQLRDVNGAYELLVGSESGYVYQYGNIDGNLSGAFTLVDTMYQQIYQPKMVSIAVGDVDGDHKFDLLTGNLCGGLQWYTQSTGTSLDEAVAANWDFRVSPNPTAGELFVETNLPAGPFQYKLSLFDVCGKELLKKACQSSVEVLDVRTFPSGIYLLQLNFEGHIFVKKLIKQ